MLNQTSVTSAPMVTPDNTVIASDDQKMVRFDSLGNVMWTATPAGIPVSPNVADSGLVVIATEYGPVSAFEPKTGSQVAQLMLSGTVKFQGKTLTGIYDTINTAAIETNRVYVVTGFRVGKATSQLPFGRLYALDLVFPASGGASLQEAWHFDFRAPSGGSPTISQLNSNTYINFDGAGLAAGSGINYQAMAVQDNGTSATLLWSLPIPQPIRVSPAVDPRGGLWYFGFTSPIMYRLSQTDGSVLQTMDMGAVLGAGLWPCSAMSISNPGGGADPTMTVAATTNDKSQSYVVNIDLQTEIVNWKVEVDQGKGAIAVPYGQFPIIPAPSPSTSKAIVFTTNANGVWALSGT
jgi:hypothetical protein